MRKVTDGGDERYGGLIPASANGLMAWSMDSVSQIRVRP